MKIRSMEIEDIVQIRSILLEGEPYVSNYNDYIYWILSTYFSTTCFVAEIAGDIVGYIGAMPSMSKEVVFIWQIVVKEEARGQQIGKLLLQSVLRSAKTLGFQQVEIGINEGNNPCMVMVERVVTELGFTMQWKEHYEDTGFQEGIYGITMTFP